MSDFPTEHSEQVVLNRVFDESTNTLRTSGGGTGASSDQIQGTAADNAASVGNPVKVGGRYESGTDTYADGDVGDLHIDENGNLKTTLATSVAGENITQDVLGTNSKPVVSSTYSGTGFMAPLNDVDISVKGSAGNILSLTCSNINAAVRYLQVFNKATAPAASDVPVFSFVIAAGTSTAPAIREIGKEFFGEGGHYLSSGVAIGVSTVAGSFTAATTTDHTINGTFV